MSWYYGYLTRMPSLFEIRNVWHGNRQSIMKAKANVNALNDSHSLLNDTYSLITKYTLHSNQGRMLNLTLAFEKNRLVVVSLVRLIKFRKNRQMIFRNNMFKKNRNKFKKSIRMSMAQRIVRTYLIAEMGSSRI